MMYESTKAKLELVFQSYGLKTGKPLPKADLYFDCRAVGEHGGFTSGLTGKDQSFQDMVETSSASAISAMESILYEAIPLIPARRSQSTNPYAEPFVVLCMCAHGIHRSVATKHILAKYMIENGWKVKVE